MRIGWNYVSTIQQNLFHFKKNWYKTTYMKIFTKWLALDISGNKNQLPFSLFILHESLNFPKLNSLQFNLITYYYTINLILILKNYYSQ